MSAIQTKPLLQLPINFHPTNADSTVRSHLYLSWCCSATLHRQQKGNPRGEESFHFLDAAERRITESQVSNHHKESHTSNTLVEERRACASVSLLGSLFLDVVVDFRRRTHGSHKGKKGNEKTARVSSTSGPKTTEPMGKYKDY